MRHMRYCDSETVRHMHNIHTIDDFNLYEIKH